MMPLLQAINKKMNSHVSKLAESNEMFEAKDLAGKFSLDGLASCAFGVETGSFDEKDSEFMLHIKEMFNIKGSFMLLMVLAIFTPNFIKKIAAKLGIFVFSRINANEDTKFLMHVVEASFKLRKQSQTKRNDLIDMMIEAIDGTLELLEEDDIHATDQYEKDAKIITHDKKKNLSYDDVIATAMIMLSAGYETTGTTMSYLLYELALHQDIQDTLYEEIKDATSTENNKLSYDQIIK